MRSPGRANHADEERAMLEHSAIVVWPVLLVLAALIPVLLGVRAYQRSRKRVGVTGVGAGTILGRAGMRAADAHGVPAARVGRQDVLEAVSVLPPGTEGID